LYRPFEKKESHEARIPECLMFRAVASDPAISRDYDPAPVTAQFGDPLYIGWRAVKLKSYDLVLAFEKLL
jgi:hypothetical protein